MDASVQDYIWNGSVQLKVDTSDWTGKDWCAQIDEFLSRNRTSMNSWRGFRDIPELINRHMKLSRGAFEVLLTDATTGVSGFGTISSDVHARVIIRLSRGRVALGYFLDIFLLLTRKGSWVRLEVTYREMPVEVLTRMSSRVIVTRWHLQYIEDDELVRIIGAQRGRGAGIFFEFERIMKETEDALQTDLENQRMMRQAYDRVLSRLKY